MALTHGLVSEVGDERDRGVESLERLVQLFVHVVGPANLVHSNLLFRQL